MNDQKYMELALKQAYKALEIQEVPIGAVLVDKSGVVIARGYNQVEKKMSQLAHAEMLVLQKAAKKLKSWRLLDLTLYVTVQPCMMCLGALYLSRIFRVVYGVSSPKFGMSLHENEASGIYKNLSMSIECMEYKKARDVLQVFFHQKRSVNNVEKIRLRKD